ncbi:unnamed protein product [Rangifer tarandus platyrhynchus]|uniref:Uncharacterized protein n=1 Tax=Rangifer tarandus platyrhynchus TaxID=3082113 RepID=A0ACB1KDH0_RANTA
MVTVCCVFTALHWNSTRTCNICCLRTLFSFNNIKLHSLSISYTAKVLPGVILLYGSLVYKYIFLGVIPVDETISVPYIEPFYCSQNLRCDDLVPAGRRRRCDAARATAPCAAARRAGLGVGSAEGGGGGGGGSGRLLGLGLAAHSCGDGDWGRLRQLRLLPGCDGN